MTKQERIDKFKGLGFGVFVHFGLYSALGKGEWAKYFLDIPDEEYEKLAPGFNPENNWADDLVRASFEAGAKYITLTARHHDGFSLYDTKGLSDYSAVNFIGRDLVGEFVAACNKYGVVPFFYHTTMDWRHPKYKADFPGYLEYLRASVELLCKNYGAIGGFWFDGNWDWNNENADWEEDALYGLIRKYQPDAIIINNTSTEALGTVGHPEIDSLTFERGRPDKSAGALASEMCEVIGGAWGYSHEDIRFKSLQELLTSYMTCRRYGANFLMNVSPKGNGLLPEICTAALKAFGKWNRAYSLAVTKTFPTGLDLGEERFLLTDGEGGYYLFESGIKMSGDPLAKAAAGKGQTAVIQNFPAAVKRVLWLDNGEPLSFTQTGNELEVRYTAFPYGRDLIWRVAKIETAPF